MKSTHTEVNRRDRRKANIMTDEIIEAEHAVLNAEHALTSAKASIAYYKHAWKATKVQRTNAEFINLRLRKRLATYKWLFWLTLTELVIALGYVITNLVTI